ncbi:MAG: hypothetical protein KDB69_06320, partial [Acidimicrobiia bacterium]|nr:hypothetical protein [Acidimicrobiia bacterium]
MTSFDDLEDALPGLINEICMPALHIEKATNGQDADTPTGPTIDAGDPVTWTYVVSNPSAVTVHDITVTDDNNDGATISCPGGNGSFDLAPGASVECSASSISWYAHDHTQHANTATAVGHDSESNQASDTDPSHYVPTLTCPFTASGDSIVIDIFGATGGYLRQAGDSLGPIAVAVPAGTYEVKWASYDAHAVKGETNPGQTEEVWYLDFATGESTDTADLAWNADHASGTLGSYLELTGAETAVTVRHGADSPSVNSIYAICAELDPISPATIDVTKTLLNSGDLYDGDEAYFEVVITNPSDDETLEVTSLTENIGGGDIDLLATPNAPGLESNTCNDALPITVGTDSSVTCQFSIIVTSGMTSATDDRCTVGDKVDVVTGEGLGSKTGTTSQDDDCAELSISPAPDIVVSKTQQEPGPFLPGTEVFFDVTIDNNSATEAITITDLVEDFGSGDVDLLADPMDPALASNTCNTNPSISIGAEGQFDCSFSIIVDGATSSATHDECPTPGSLVDVVSAAGTGDESGATVGDDDCEDIDLASPSIAVTKTVDPGAVIGKGDVTWTIVVTNDGTYPLMDVRAFDLMSWSGDAASLDGCEALYVDAARTAPYDGGE